MSFACVSWPQRPQIAGKVFWGASPIALWSPGWFHTHVDAELFFQPSCGVSVLWSLGWTFGGCVPVTASRGPAAGPGSRQVSGWGQRNRLRSGWRQGESGQP